MNLPLPIDLVESSAERTNYLRGSLRRIGLTQPADVVFQDRPILEQVATRLANFLTDRPTSIFTLRPLLDSCLAAALTAYFREGDDSTAGGLFLQHLIGRAADVLQTAIHAGDRIWDPTSGEDIHDFLAANPEAVLEPLGATDRRLSSRDFRRALAHRLLTPTEAAALGVSLKDIALPLP